MADVFTDLGTKVKLLLLALGFSLMAGILGPRPELVFSLQFADAVVFWFVLRYQSYGILWALFAILIGKTLKYLFATNLIGFSVIEMITTILSLFIVWVIVGSRTKLSFLTERSKGSQKLLFAVAIAGTISVCLDLGLQNVFFGYPVDHFFGNSYVLKTLLQITIVILSSISGFFFLNNWYLQHRRNYWHIVYLFAFSLVLQLSIRYSITKSDEVFFVIAALNLIACLYLSRFHQSLAKDSGSQKSDKAMQVPFIQKSEFLHQISREVNRSQRIGSNHCFVGVSSSRILSKKEMDMITELVVSHSRKTDMVTHWYESFILTFLPETNCHEAGYFAEKLQRVIRESINDKNQLHLGIGISTWIPCETHGQAISNCQVIVEKALLRGHFSIVSEQEIGITPHSFIFPDATNLRMAVDFQLSLKHLAHAFGETFQVAHPDSTFITVQKVKNFEMCLTKFFEIQNDLDQKDSVTGAQFKVLRRKESLSRFNTAIAKFSNGQITLRELYGKARFEIDLELIYQNQH